jgi:hypothetical protein
VFGGLRIIIDMESEGLCVNMSLPNSIMEFRCPLPRAGYRTKVSFILKIRGIGNEKKFGIFGLL